MGLTGTLYNIQKFALHDGPGIRTTAFFKGCPLSCWWCHNPESRSPEIQPMNGRTIGKKYTVDELLEILLLDEVFYEQSGGGVTFSGGEPLNQPDFLCAVLEKSKEHGIHTAVDTSGCAPREVFERILPYTDLFLYDLKLMDASEHFKFTSVSNKGILENLKFLLHTGAGTIVRIPLIPTITDTEKNLKKILEFLKPFSPAPEIHLLPFHRTGNGKYEKLGMTNRLEDLEELSDAEIRNRQKLFESAGYKVSLGG
jgi:pyruvate formate lyase activating enzyme